MRLKFAIISVALAFTSGCATRAVESEAVLKRAPEGLPAQATIANVPFIKQQTNYCGPATLAMSMQAAGRMITVDELAKETLSGTGTFQSDLVSAARRNGMLAVTIRGMPALLQEISAHHPVIIFENQAFPWYPMYHYALVYGYSLPDETVTMHSGPVEGKVWDIKKFERSWMLEDYWGLVVLPPGELAASQDDLAHATAAAALEKTHVFEARLVYSSILAKWPDSLAALIGLSNLDYSEGRTQRAATLLKHATETHPESAAAWHNLAIAENELGLKRQAKLAAKQALAKATPEERMQYASSLAELTL